MFMLPDAVLLEVLKDHPTPLYAYNMKAIGERIREIRNAFSSIAGFELLFATMANPSDEILTLMAQMNVGACVNSVAHLGMALKNDIPPTRIHYTSSGVRMEDMQSISAKVALFNADSISQALLWTEATKGKECGLRVNAYSLDSAEVLNHRDRIGIPASEVSSTCAAVRKAGGHITGLHVYVGTNFIEPAPMLSVLNNFFQLARDIDGLKYINIGGGIGLDYARSGERFDLTKFADMVSQYLHELEDAVGHQVTLIFEPGRGMIGESGVFLTRVTDKKSLNGIDYVLVDASVALFPRPLHHPESPHSVRSLSRSVDTMEKSVPVTIAGQTTFSRDILAKCNLSSEVKIGEVLVFEDSGAYCDSMKSSFLGQPKAVNVFTTP